MRIVVVVVVVGVPSVEGIGLAADAGTPTELPGGRYVVDAV